MNPHDRLAAAAVVVVALALSWLIAGMAGVH